ncbi:MAG: galactose oxidase [Bacteroidetes bacterium]|nr:galactose oxidase [Bacteroidota bacterium]
MSFTATATNAGTTPVYQWYKNGLAVGSNSATYTNTAWVNGDVVNCKVSSSATCALPAAAFSNNITVTTQNTNPDTWVQKADLGTDANLQAPLARSGAASFSIGSKAYMGTGFDGTNYLNDFWEYNPATNVWTQRATYTGGVRTDAVGFSVNGFGYIGTGYNGSAYLGTFRKYDPATNSWVSAATLSGIRAGASAFVVGSKAYVGTGYNGSSYLTSFREYDPATNVWTLMAAFPVASAYAGAFSIGTKGYIGDGYNGTAPINTFYEYNPASNTWTAKANIPVARQKVVGFGIGSKGYIGTGLNSAGSLSNVFYEYDPVPIPGQPRRLSPHPAPEHLLAW